MTVWHVKIAGRCVTVSALQTNAGRRDKTKFTSKTKQKELCRQDLYMPQVVQVSEAQNDEKWKIMKDNEKYVKNYQKILWKWHQWINEYDASQRKKPKPRANVFKLSYSVTPHVYSTDLQDFQDRFDMVRLAWDPPQLPGNSNFQWVQLQIGQHLETNSRN